jgi:cell division protein FtsA
LSLLNNSYICTLDIGSSKIAAIVAKIKKGQISEVFFDYFPSQGIKRGVIIDSIELVNSITGALKKLKAKSGINIKSIYTNISGEDIVTKHSRAIIPLAERGNKVITANDINKAREQARILGSSLEEEIIHAMPYSFAIDSKGNILNPIGLYSHKLEVDLYLICAKLSSIQSLTRSINQAGYEIKDLFFSGIATSKAVFNHEFKEGINILCDIGSDITELLIFNQGLLQDIKILPFGGSDLTEALCESFGITFDLAEDVKRSYGIIGDFSDIKEDKEILIKKDAMYKPIKHKSVLEVLNSKAGSICDTIKDTVENIVPCGKINNFVTAGRTVLLEGFLERLEKTLGVSVRVARLTHPDIISLFNKDRAISGQRHLTYITSLGIICQALANEKEQAPFASSSTHNPILKAINKFKEIYREYF